MPPCTHKPTTDTTFHTRNELQLPAVKESKKQKRQYIREVQIVSLEESITAHSSTPNATMYVRTNQGANRPRGRELKIVKKNIQNFSYVEAKVKESGGNRNASIYER